MGDSILPSSESLLDKTAGFLPVAQAYLCEQFHARIQTEKPAVQAGCQGIEALLQEQAAQTERAGMRVGDPWAGEIPQNAAAVAFQTAQKRDVQAAVQYFSDKGIDALRVDIAIGSESQILVGYLAGPNQDVLAGEEYTQASRLLNGCLGQKGVVSQDSVLYQAQLTGDIQGNQVASQEQIQQGLNLMQQILRGSGIELFVVKHNYQEAVGTQAVSEKASGAEVKETTAPQQTNIKPS